MAARRERAIAAEGYSFGLLVRLCGLGCFFLINPLFIWIWIDDPKFLHGTIDFGVAFMAVITAGMEFLGVFGLMANFARTRIADRQIEWGIWRRGRLDFDEIDQVVGVRPYRGTTVLQLVTKAGKRYEVSGGNWQLHQAFLRLQAELPA